MMRTAPVQRNSRKRGPWNYSLTCRPVLTQLLVLKITRENSEKSSALNTPTASANPGPSPNLCQCCLAMDYLASETEVTDTKISC